MDGHGRAIVLSGGYIRELDFGEAPWCAHGADLAHLVRVIVVGEHFLNGVPVEGAAEFDGDIGEVTDRGDSVADIDGEVGVFTGADAIQEVAVFAFGVGIQPGIVGAELGMEYGVGTGFERAAPAGVPDPAF